MTATVTDNTQETREGGIGRVSRIIGPVVDIEFPADAMPEQYNLLHHRRSSSRARRRT